MLLYNLADGGFIMIERASDYIRSKIGDFAPEIGVILGSGLGDLADEYCDIAIPYAEIPGFESSTVLGHKGRLVFANINGKNVVMMQGRFHYYEGHSIQKVVFPVKVDGAKDLLDAIMLLSVL